MELNDFVIRLRDSGPFDYIMRKKEGKCIFLKDKLCSIYEVRPIICRFYPFKLENLGGNKYRFSYTDECPSIGKGPHLKRTFYEALFKKFLILISKEHAN
jgi:Fe-S-cluster containining protein